MFKSFLLKKKIKIIKSKIKNLISVNDFYESVNKQETNELFKEVNLKNWLRNHGIEITTIPPFSMGGSGIAYFLNNKFVLKITDDLVEANIAKMLIDSKVDHSMISVLKIKKYYCILQHKLNTENTSESLKTAADLVTVMIDDYELEEFPDDDKIKEMCISTLSENGFSNSYLSKMLIIIKILKELEQTTGFFHDDAGPTNIGTKDDKTYVFDLGANKTKDYNAERAIKKINIKREKLGLPKHNFDKL